MKALGLEYEPDKYDESETLSRLREALFNSPQNVNDIRNLKRINLN